MLLGGDGRDLLVELHVLHERDMVPGRCDSFVGAAIPAAEAGARTPASAEQTPKAVARYLMAIGFTTSGRPTPIEWVSARVDAIRGS